MISILFAVLPNEIVAGRTYKLEHIFSIMQIRRVEEGEEYCYTDNGYEICCPICGTAWLEEIEGEFNIDNCEHLRFSLHSDRGDDFDIFEDWDSDGFLEMVEKAREEDEDEVLDIFEIPEKIQHPEVDVVMIYIWHEDPLYNPWTLWGYQE